MIYNKNGNLSELETLQRTLFKSPENSLVAFGYDRIHHFKTYRLLTYHYLYSDVMTRLYAFAVPIFAFLDTLQFTGKSAYQLITLNFESAFHTACKCAKAFQICLAATLMWIPSIVSPTAVLKDERFWIEIQKKVTIQKIEQSEGLKNLENGVEDLELILKEQANLFILEETTRALCNACIEEMIHSLPKDLDRAKIVASTYVSMITNFLVTASNKNIEFNQKKEFLSLLKELVKIQDPEFKENLFTLMLVYQASLKELTKSVKFKEKTNNPLVLTFLLRLLTDNEECIIKISQLLKHNYFSNIVYQRNFLKTLITIHNAQLTNEQNNQLLASFTLLFPVPQLTTSSNAKIGVIKVKNKQEITKKLNKNQIKTTQIKEKLQTLSPGDAIKKDQAYVLYQKTSKQLSDLQKLGEKLKAQLPSEGSTDTAVIFSASTITRGLQNLMIILHLPSKEMIENIIDSLSLSPTDGKRYKSLSDDAILKDLFIRIFSFDAQASQNLSALWTLRAPEALLKFHLRLMEYTGADRNAVLQKNKEVVLSILKGTFWQSRFKTENNPHLKQVFDNRLDLMSKWTDENPRRSKVQELIPSVSEHCKNCEITLSKDPSDILLIGNDLRHCLNLNGRLTRMAGLLAFLADGKTHMIVAKSSDKGPSLAQTLIMLLWDETRNQPVLLLEETSFRGKEERDYTLENATIAYAKRMAKDLGVELVVSDYRNSDPNTRVIGKKYEGSVVSLKTSSPIEYVYSLNSIEKPPYAMGQCYHVIQ